MQTLILCRIVFCNKNEQTRRRTIDFASLKNVIDSTLNTTTSYGLIEGALVYCLLVKTTCECTFKQFHCSLTCDSASSIAHDILERWNYACVDSRMFIITYY